MGNLAFFENLIDAKLLSLHTAYLAKVLAVNGNTAKIQPLGMSKAYGESAKAQSPLSRVPVLRSAMFKFSEKEIEYVTDVDSGEKVKTKVTVPMPLAKGDIVLCVCCERNITDALKGKNTIPPVGHHQQGDSVIVGIL